ncbi:MAG: HAD family hydrolase [Pseudonocardiaceae bacterium]
MLVTLDVGGTLGHADGPTVTGVLATASPLGARQARRIMRDILHTQPEITLDVIAAVCDALRVPDHCFPLDLTPSPLTLLPGVADTLRAMNRHASLVTLSNVTCVEADLAHLRELLSPWVVAHFPSCCIGYAKPNQDAFAAVARSCGVPVSETVHIGDDWECDIIGARNAGATAIWIAGHRPVPDPGLLTDPKVLVVANIAQASEYVTNLATTRRQS